MTALVAIEAVVILLLVVLVAGLLRSHAEILRRLHELGAGEPDVGSSPSGLPTPVRRRTTGLGEVAVDTVTGATPAGGAASIPLKGSRGLTLLAFLTTGCTSCRAFWLERPEGPVLERDDLRVLVVTKGPEHESPGTVQTLNSQSASVVMSTEVWEGFGVPVSPYFMLVDGSDGAVLGEGAGTSWAQVADLVGRSLSDSPAGGNLPPRSTTERLRDTEEELRRAGIEPGDPSLFRIPSDGAPE